METITQVMDQWRHDWSRVHSTLLEQRVKENARASKLIKDVDPVDLSIKAHSAHSHQWIINLGSTRHTRSLIAAQPPSGSTVLPPIADEYQ